MLKFFKLNFNILLFFFQKDPVYVFLYIVSIVIGGDENMLAMI